MKKSKIKAFTLIELLVVVAIIGILAAVGVVSFGGFTGSAKISSTKANHAQAIKSLSAELKKCEIQGGSITLKTGTVVQCTKSGTSTTAFASAFVASLNADGFKNPYDTGQVAFVSSGGVTGQTLITVSSSTVTLTTKILKSDGTDDTPLTATVVDERG